MYSCDAFAQSERRSRLHGFYNLPERGITDKARGAG